MFEFQCGIKLHLPFEDTAACVLKNGIQAQVFSLSFQDKLIHSPERQGVFECQTVFVETLTCPFNLFTQSKLNAV